MNQVVHLQQASLNIAGAKGKNTKRTTLKKTTYIFALLAAAFLAACGGGGGGSDAGPGSSTPPPAVVTPPPVVATILNPLTGAAAPGSPTKSIQGVAIANAVVTAYAVNPDGSSGAALGPAATAGVGGDYVLSLTAAPTGWVRIISRGGTYERKSDATKHAVDTLELVTPFVTTSYNVMVITPVSDIAARIMAFKVKTGSTLVDAFKFGIARTLQLDVANLLIPDEPSVYLNVLKGRIQGDTYNAASSPTMGELLLGIEHFGIMYDIPQPQAWRAIAAAGENSYPLSTVDGAGAAINVGAWVNGKFDTNAVVSLKTLMNANTLDEIKVTDNRGARVAPKVSDMVSRYLIQDALAYHACTTGFDGNFKNRYPFFPLENGKISAATCADVTRRTVDFFKRVEASYLRYK